jgi:thioredoxin reductase (NADPH)
MREVTDIQPGSPHHVLTLADGGEVAARVVIIAAGVAYRRLPVPALDRLSGDGVFYGAAVSEAQAMKGRNVFVAGGGNSAGQAALHLAKHAASVTVLVRGAGLAASMSQYLITEIAAHPRIDVRTHCEVVDGSGAGRLEWLTLHDTITGAQDAVTADALFVLIGAEPHTAWLPPDIVRDGWGFIVTGSDLMLHGKPPPGWPVDRMPLLHETSVPGIFAVGDVRHRSIKRVASAVGEGSVCVSSVHEYLAALP